MFKIKGPILAATDLKGSDELLRQADTLARSYHVKLSACRVIPESFAVRLLLTQLHLDDAQRLYDLEAAVRNALLKRIRTVTRREPPRIEMETEQGTVHAGILWAADCIGAGVVVVGGSRSQGAKHPGRRCGAGNPLRALCRSCGAALACRKGAGSERLFRPRTSS
jgi:hypothetical protein